MGAARMSAAVRPRPLSAKNQHIVTRFSFGVSESLLRDVGSRRSGSAWLAKQLYPSKISDAYGNRVVSWFPRLRDSPGDAWARVVREERTAWDYGYDFTCYTMARKISSRRQVLEVMADFWSNLLYIPAYEDRSFAWRFHYDQTIRKYALTSYRQLLRAAVVHPAMSGWLNNNSNTKRGINENLGRELLELYTVGRPSGYDEQDVQNSARLLTGFKVDVFDGYAARYEPADHFVGRVKVLGFTHANSRADGRPAVNAYLDYLARHPSTARRVATRLCTRFVSDRPSSSIVSAVARAYTKHDTDIKATLRALVAHPDFQASRRSKVRTPTEDVVNTARLLGMRPTGASADLAFARHVIWMSANLGQHQFSWPRPDGFPETSAAWASPARLLRSWSLHYSLAGSWWGSKQVSRRSKQVSLPTKWPRTLGEIVEHQSRMLLGRPSTSELRSTVATTMNRSLSYRYAKLSAISDWEWTLIRGAVLNSPDGVMR